MKSGYQAAIRLAREKLEQQEDHKGNAGRLGVNYQDERYFIPWFGGWRELASGNDAEQIIWLHYLTSDGGRRPTGEWVAYRDLQPALFYEPKFFQRAVTPLVKRFGPDISQLIPAAESIGGRKADRGDASVTIPLLPMLPLTYILFQGDDEFPPDGNILFDKTAGDWLHAEDLAVLASLGTYKLISLYPV